MSFFVGSKDQRDRRERVREEIVERGRLRSLEVSFKSLNIGSERRRVNYSIRRLT